MKGEKVGKCQAERRQGQESSGFPSANVRKPAPDAEKGVTNRPRHLPALLGPLVSDVFKNVSKSKITDRQLRSGCDFRDGKNTFFGDQGLRQGPVQV